MTEEASITNPLGTEKIEKLMIRYAIPSIISFVVNSLYNMVDQIFIGQGVGYLGNAATNVIMPLTTIMLAIGLLIGDGAAAFMSLNLGQGNREAAARSVGNMISLTIFAGIISLIIFEVLLGPLSSLFGATESIMPYALDYGKIIVLGFPFFAVNISFASMIRADGRPNETMVGLLIGCVTNMILDPLFIFVFHWGVQGAAWATIIGQFLNTVYFVFCIFRFQTFKLKIKFLCPDIRISRKIITLGFSSFITQIAAVFVIGVMNNLLVNYGGQSRFGSDIPLATFGITMKVCQLAFGVALGIATSVQPLLGYNYGSGQFDRVKKTFRITMAVSIFIMCIALVVFQIFPESIIRLFGQESELYMEFAVLSFRIFLLACFLQPVPSVAGIFFQSIGRPFLSAACSMSRQIVFMIPAMLFLGDCFGIEGILWAGPVADTFSTLVSCMLLGLFWEKTFRKGEVDYGTD